MVLFNYGTKEITAKIVYYGPGLCGKTTNLQFIFDSLPSNNKSKMLSLATKTDRTLFFDFLPLDLGKIRGMRTKLQLYTVPGQVFYNSTRQLVLKGADGIVFVADSQSSAVDANRESFQNLEDNLKRQGIRISEIPVVIQYNKRDLPNVLPVAKLNAALNKINAPHEESVATTGIGVEKTLKSITQVVLNHLVRKYGLEGSGPIEKEIHILNPTLPVVEPAAPETLWEDDVLATELARPHSDVVVEDVQEGEAAPMVATELVSFTSPSAEADTTSPFDELIETTGAPIPRSAAEKPTPVPMTSVEIPLPPSPARAGTAASERRAADGLVKEVTIPITLTLEELRAHRRLRLKITLDVNLLP